MQIPGALPRPAGNPSPRGVEGGRPFSKEFAGTLRKHLGNPSPQGAEGGARRQQVETKINEYAAFFVEQMMQAMRRNVMPSGLADGGRAEQAFQGMMDRHLSEKLAASLRFQRSFGKALERLDKPGPAAVQESSIQA